MMASAQCMVLAVILKSANHSFIAVSTHEYMDLGGDSPSFGVADLKNYMNRISAFFLSK